MELKSIPSMRSVTAIMLNLFVCGLTRVSKFKLLCDMIILFQTSKDAKANSGDYSHVYDTYKILITIQIHLSETDQRMYTMV